MKPQPGATHANDSEQSEAVQRMQGANDDSGMGPRMAGTDSDMVPPLPGDGDRAEAPSSEGKPVK
jgi:hypothetical protein